MMAQGLWPDDAYFFVADKIHSFQATYPGVSFVVTLDGKVVPYNGIIEGLKQ
jgi:hypothetical protein